MTTTTATTDEIRDVRRLSRDGGDYIAKCPHCGQIIALEGNDLSEMRGEQYQHRQCGGWLQVADNAFYVRQL